jgi:hypothetical protein
MIIDVEMRLRFLNAYILEVLLSASEHDDLSWLSDKQQFAWPRRVAHNKLVDHDRRSSRCDLIPLEGEDSYHGRYQGIFFYQVSFSGKDMATAYGLHRSSGFRHPAGRFADRCLDSRPSQRFG